MVRFCSTGALCRECGNSIPLVRYNITRRSCRGHRNPYFKVILSYYLVPSSHDDQDFSNILNISKTEFTKLQSKLTYLLAYPFNLVFGKRVQPPRWQQHVEKSVRLRLVETVALRSERQEIVHSLYFRTRPCSSLHQFSLSLGHC